MRSCSGSKARQVQPMCTPGMGVDSWGESPLQEDQAHGNGLQLLAKGKGVSARRGPKEAGGKAASRRTGTS